MSRKLAIVACVCALVGTIQFVGCNPRPPMPEVSTQGEQHPLGEEPDPDDPDNPTGGASNRID